jgi:iron complex outermembrane recepter protein
MKLLFLSFFFLVAFSSIAQEIKSALDKTTNEIAKDTVKPKVNSLDEVTVYGNKKQFMKTEGDKTIVDVKNNPMLSTGTAFEAVKKLPGVITSPTQNLMLNGKDLKIYIDGSPSVLSGTDLQNYLSSLPANAIEKIELIYSPGASYDASFNGSVINIVTSSKRLKGINATLDINYNFNQYQKPSSQVTLNGKENSFSWQTMLGYDYIESGGSITNKQTFTFFNPKKQLYQDNFEMDTDRNAFFRLGTNFKISKKSNLLFNYNGAFSNNRRNYNSKITGDIPYFESSRISNIKINNNELSLQFKTQLDTLGRTLDIVSFTNIFDKSPKSLSNGTGNSLNNSEVDFKLQNYYLKYDFVIPFKKINLTLDTGGKYNSINIKNNGRYFSNTNALPPTINFDYTENNLAFYGELHKKIKKWNLTAGLRFEDFKVKRLANTITNKINYNTTNFFPNASVLYEITDKINVSATFSKKIEQPGYSTIDPNISSDFNQYTISTGNIDLKPIFFDNYSLKVSAFDYFELGANYVETKDKNSFVFNAKDGELVSNQTRQIFDKTKNFTAFVSFPIPLDYFFKGKEEFSKRMNTMDKMNYVTVSVYYLKSFINGFNLPYKNEGIFNVYAQSQLILPYGITNVMSYYIWPKGNWEIYKFDKPIQEFDISFSKDFMRKKLKIGLHCFDLFNANETSAFVVGKNLESDFYQKTDSRSFRFSLTYNFGNLGLENENTSIETEKAKEGGGMMK